MTDTRPLEKVSIPLVDSLNEFANETERFRKLPPNLKKVAIDIALKALGIKNDDLFMEAGEADAFAISDPFAHTLQEAGGKVVENYISFSAKVLEAAYLRAKIHNRLDKLQAGETPQRIGLFDDGSPREEIDTEEVMSSQLRESLASRWSKIALAQELGCKPGQFVTIVKNPDFQAANDLCWQMVREFQTRS